MKHQGEVGSWAQRKGLQVRIVPWRAQGGQWWLFPATFPGVTVAVCFLSWLQTLAVQGINSHCPLVPQAVSPWTPSSARAWKKAETSSKSFPRALPSLP